MLRGNCLCGAVRYEVGGSVHDVHNCHCSMCRRSHGGAFSTFARMNAADLRYLAGREHVRGYRSSPQIERAFCDTCGSRLTITFDGMPESVWISVGTLDDGADLKPESHMFVGSKAAWHEIGDALPQFKEYGPMGE